MLRRRRARACSRRVRPRLRAQRLRVTPFRPAPGASVRLPARLRKRTRARHWLRRHRMYAWRRRVLGRRSRDRQLRHRGPSRGATSSLTSRSTPLYGSYVTVREIAGAGEVRAASCGEVCSGSSAASFVPSGAAPSAAACSTTASWAACPGARRPVPVAFPGRPWLAPCLPDLTGLLCRERRLPAMSAHPRCAWVPLARPGEPECTRHPMRFPAQP